MNVPSAEIVTPLPPLSEPLTDLPPVQYAKPRTEQRETIVTTLSNGLKVASETRFGQFCTIGGEFPTFCIINLSQIFLIY